MEIWQLLIWELEKFRCIFTAIDAFTRFLVAVPIKQKYAVVIATTLVEHLFLPFGTWRTIVSDQGKEFCNEVLDKVASLLEVHKLRTTSTDHQRTASLNEFTVPSII